MVTTIWARRWASTARWTPSGNAQALVYLSKAKGDGTTIMMFHDMAFLSVLSLARSVGTTPWRT